VTISSLGLTRVVEYDPADLTVTVQSGCRLSDLQATLGKNGQFLPVDHEGGTIGGAIAGGATGALALGYGALRDRLLRIRAVTAAGEMTTTGSKVVKSVAGFDLGKVYCGSFGTLVFITEATFKLAPLPRESRSLAFSGTLDDVRSWSDRVLSSPFRPLTLQVVNGLAARESAYEPTQEGQFVINLRLGGRPAAVERQSRELTSRARSAGLQQHEPAGSDLDAPDSLVDREACAAVLKVQPSELLAALSLATAADAPAFCEFGSNQLRFWSRDRTVSALLDELWRLKDPAKTLVRRDGGEVRWRRGLADEARGLITGIKKALDPHDIFQRGLLPQLLYA
jgi:FAD/FMN-containing dehydrogenase